MKIIFTVFFTAAVVWAANAQTPIIAAQATYPSGHNPPQLSSVQVGRYELRSFWPASDSADKTTSIQCSLSDAGYYQLHTTAPTYWTPPVMVTKMNNSRHFLINEYFRRSRQHLYVTTPHAPDGTSQTTNLLYSPLIPPQLPPSPPLSQDEKEIFFRTHEFWPIFNGCETLPDYGEQRNCSRKKTIEYIYQHYKYPAIGDACVQGTIVVLCNIETDGSVSNVRTVRGLHPSFDAEAERVVASMPRWTPGRMYDKVVRMEMIFPVRIRLK